MISNEYGDRPLKIGSAHVALEAEGAQAWATFQGAGEVLVAAGARALALLAFSVLAWDTVSNRTASPPAAGRRLPL